MSDPTRGQARGRSPRRPHPLTRTRTCANPFRRPTPKMAEVTVPVGALSIYDQIHLGTDENGMPVAVTLAYRNLLAGGEPGAGKRSVLNLIVGHGALCPDCRLWLLDGKRVELGLWREIADVFVGSDIDHAITTLR
jgi:DNA segregation ATPase FtsK/SpoIIIE, S-DNA-T family